MMCISEKVSDWFITFVNRSFMWVDVSSLHKKTRHTPFSMKDVSELITKIPPALS